MNDITYGEGDRPFEKTKQNDRQLWLAHIETKAKEIDQEIALLQGRAANPKAREFASSQSLSELFSKHALGLKSGDLK